MSGTEFPTAEVLPLLPDYFRPDRGDAIPPGLVGAKIVGFGTLAEPQAVEGGGLVIDYTPDGVQGVRRVVFGFNELGMWVTFVDDRE